MAQSLKDSIYTAFGLEDKDLRTYSPLTLAYIGDGVFDLLIRSLVVGRANMPPNRLHGHTSHIVKASSQARIMEAIGPDLTEEEADIFRRGRNAKSYTHAKNASLMDYRIATGFEALMGWHYLQGNMDRIIELTKIGLEETDLSAQERR